jgi:hypothetical protein
LVTRGAPLELGSRTVDTDLIILGLEGIDVILGMDWMNLHKVVLDISENDRDQLTDCLSHDSIPTFRRWCESLFLCGNHFSAGRNSSGLRVCRCFSR